jgi:hypothetical protein
MFRAKIIQKIITHFMFNNLCSHIVPCTRFGENFNTHGQNTCGNKARLMLIACWIPNATNVHPEYVILIAFPLQQWLHEGAAMLRNAYIVCHFIRNETECRTSKPRTSVLVITYWRRKRRACLFNTYLLA